MVQLMVNDLVEDLETGAVYRILWIDSDIRVCHCIDIKTAKFKIITKKLEDIINGFDNGVYTISQKDGFVKILDEDRLSEKRKESLNKRYNIVKTIYNDETIPKCFERKYRGKLVKKAMETYGVSEKTVYQYLRMFFQGGCIINALADNYDNCGKCDNRQYKAKPGRKSEEYMADNEHSGMIISDDVKKVFQYGMSRYYKNGKKMPLTKVLEYINDDYFADLPEHKRPTINQFYYWKKRNDDKDSTYKKRYGESDYRNNKKPLLSDTRSETFGPGFRYMVDSTPFPIKLVNRIDRNNCVGSPTIFVSADVDSTIIAGVSVHLHGDSWEGYASLLYNTFTDKVQYCKNFGVDIAPEEWDVSGIPKVIMGDRGGILAKHSTMLSKHFGITLENAPPYIANAKSVVEKKFDLIENLIKYELPGVIEKKLGERGYKDPGKEASLDIEQFTRIVILAVLELNARILIDFDLEKEQIWDNVVPNPNSLWAWGMENKTGSLRKPPSDLLRYHLLKHATASIDRKGITFKDMYYICDIGVRENWFSGLNGTQKVEIAYDSRCMDTILLYDKLSNTFIECELNKELTANSPYFNRTMDEISLYKKYKKAKVNPNYRNLNASLRAEGREKRNSVAQEGKSMNEGEKVNVTNVKENRAIENKIHEGKYALTGSYNSNKNNPEYTHDKSEGQVNEHDNAINSRKALAGLIGTLIEKEQA